MRSEGLELGVAVAGFMVLITRLGDVLNEVGSGDTYPCSDNICNVRRVGSHRRLLCVNDLPWRW